MKELIFFFFSFREFAGLHQKMDQLGFVLPPANECLKGCCFFLVCVCFFLAHKSVEISKSNRVNFNDFVKYLKASGAFQYWRT